MGAQLLKEVASKTNDIAGDGTTSATILGHAIFKEGLKNVVAGSNPMELKRGIQEAVNVIVEGIKGFSQNQLKLKMPLLKLHLFLQIMTKPLVI